MARAGMLGKLLASGSAVAFTLQAASLHRQNLFTYSDPTTVDATTFPTNSNVTAVSSGYITHPGGGTFAGGVVFGDNSLERTAYKTVSTLSVGARYIISAYVLMGDSAAPDPGSSGAGKDFAFYFNGGDETSAAAYTVTAVGSSVYRVSCPIIYASGTTFGVHKNTGHSTKTFKVSGFQLEKVPSVSSTVGTYTPTGATAEYGKYRLSSTYRVMDATATVTVLEEANGAKYAEPGAGAPSSQVNAVAWHPGGAYVAAVGNGGLFAWAWSDTTGYGAQCSSIPTLPGGAGGACLAWSPAGDYLLVGHVGTAKFSVYPFNASTGTFSAALASPVTTPDTVGATIVNGCAWHPSDGSFALAFDATPGCYYYQVSAGVIGAAASPTGGTPGAAYCVTWNVAGSRLVVGHNGTAANQTYLSMWAWASAASGALQTEPASPPGAAVVAIDFHPSGLYAAYADGGTAYIRGYNVTSGTAWGAALTARALDGVCGYNTVKFSPSGEHVGCAHANGNYLSMIPFAGAFAPELAAPSTSANGSLAFGWSPSGRAFATGGQGYSSLYYLHIYAFHKASSETWTPNRLDGWIQASAANYARQGMLISSSYLPMTIFTEVRQWNLKLDKDALDSTVFQATWRTHVNGLKKVTGSCDGFRSTDATLVAALTGSSPLVLELWDNTTSSSEPIARVRALPTSHSTDTSVADLVKEGFEWEGYGDADNRVAAFPILAL